MFLSRNSLLYLVVIFFSFIGCEQKRAETSLFDVDSLINSQASMLAEMKAELHKDALIGTAEDDTTYSPSTKNAWKTELDLFRKLDDVNKTVSKGSYLVDDSLFDVSSNLTVRAISAATEDQAVRYIRIFYDDDVTRPRKIEALYNDENEMYASGKTLSMEFQEVDDKNILTAYAIQGGQKMILGDSVTYVIRGKIVIK